jgi:Flp pilus assembly pilin Flp
MSKARGVVDRGQTVIKAIRQLWAEESGQDVAEYAVMLAVILVIVIGTVRLIGGNANNVFSQVSSGMAQLTARPAPLPPAAGFPCFFLPLLSPYKHPHARLIGINCFLRKRIAQKLAYCPVGAAAVFSGGSGLFPERGAESGEEREERRDFEGHLLGCRSDGDGLGLDQFQLIVPRDRP